MATALTDWNQLAGMVHPSSSRLVCRSANTVSEAPACSKAIQKKITKNERMKITAMRSQSSRSRGLSCSGVRPPPRWSAGGRPRGRPSVSTT